MYCKVKLRASTSKLHNNNNYKTKNSFQLECRIPYKQINSEIFFDMFHNSKFLETLPLEHFYLVVKHVLKSAWFILRVVFEAQLKNLNFN